MYSARASRFCRGTAVGIYYVMTYLGFALPFVHAKLAKGWGDAGTLRATAGLAAACLVARAAVEFGVRRRRA